MSIRMKPADRRLEILEAALVAAQRHGWARMTRDHVAAVAKTSPGLVSARLGTMDALRGHVMRLAVRQGVESVVAEGLALRHPAALKAPDDLKARALASLIK